MIESETRFLLKFVFQILLFPVRLVQVIFGKKDTRYLSKPFRELVEFIFQAKFTITIILVNIFVFILSLFFDLSGFVHYPVDIFSRPYTIITTGFLHASIGHLVGNMIGIFVFGRVVERKLKTPKTVIVYFFALFISVFFSSLIHLLMGQNTGGVGASGALMGLVSTAMLLDPFYITYELLIPMPVMLVGWLTLYADIIGLLGPADGIGHLAHLGGFLSVGLIAALIEKDKKLKRGLYINIASFSVFVVLLYFV